MSLKNLSTCYAYQYILGRTLNCLRKKDNEEGVEFIKSLTRYLLTNCYLTNKQIEGLAKWLQFLPKDLAEAKLERFNYEK